MLPASTIFNIQQSLLQDNYTILNYTLLKTEQPKVKMDGIMYFDLYFANKKHI